MSIYIVTQKGEYHTLVNVVNFDQIFQCGDMYQAWWDLR